MGVVSRIFSELPQGAYGGNIKSGPGLNCRLLTYLPVQGGSALSTRLLPGTSTVSASGCVAWGKEIAPEEMARPCRPRFAALCSPTGFNPCEGPLSVALVPSLVFFAGSAGLASFAFAFEFFLNWLGGWKSAPLHAPKYCLLPCRRCVSHSLWVVHGFWGVSLREGRGVMTQGSNTWLESCSRI